MLTIIFFLAATNISHSSQYDLSEDGFILELIFIQGNPRTAHFKAENFLNFSLHENPDIFLKKIRALCKEENIDFLAAFYNSPNDPTERYVITLITRNTIDHSEIYSHSLKFGEHFIELKYLGFLNKEDWKEFLKEKRKGFKKGTPKSLRGKTFFLLKGQRKIRHIDSRDLLEDLGIFFSYEAPTYFPSPPSERSIFSHQK